MMTGGWSKLPHALLEGKIYRDQAIFKVAVTCVSLANRNGGEFETYKKSLATQCHLDRNKLWRILKYLEKKDIITIESAGKEIKIGVSFSENNDLNAKSVSTNRAQSEHKSEHKVSTPPTVEKKPKNDEKRAQSEHKSEHKVSTKRAHYKTEETGKTENSTPSLRSGVFRKKIAEPPKPAEVDAFEETGQSFSGGAEGARESNGAVEGFAQAPAKAMTGGSNGAGGGSAPLTPRHGGARAGDVPIPLDQDPTPPAPVTVPRRVSPPYSADFEAFWKAYPRVRDKSQTWEEWDRLGMAGELPPLEQLLAVLKAYRDYEWDGDGAQFIPSSVNWLKKDYWRDSIENIRKRRRSNGRTRKPAGYADATDEAAEKLNRELLGASYRPK